MRSYKDNEAEARVPPLARAEEDSLAPFGIGEEAHGHKKRKVRRTIRRFFMDGQTYYRGHHVVTGTQLAAFFGQATVQRVWNPAREAQQIEQQQRRQRHRRYWQALAADIYEFRDGEVHLRFAPAVTASHQVTHPKKTGYMTFNAQSLVRPGRLNWIATYRIDKNIQVAGLQDTRLGGGRKEYRIRASPLDTKSAQFVVFRGYGATSRLKVADGGTNMSSGVSLVLRADLYPTSCIRRRFNPPVKLQGSLGGVLVHCRGLPGNQELHEKIIVAHSPLEEAEPTLLDLFWNTLHEWVVAPPRRANVVLLQDANGRVGQDYRCTESHEMANDWVSVALKALKLLLRMENGWS